MDAAGERVNVLRQPHAVSRELLLHHLERQQQLGDDLRLVRRQQCSAALEVVGRGRELALACLRPGLGGGRPAPTSARLDDLLARARVAPRQRLEEQRLEPARSASSLARSSRCASASNGIPASCIATIAGWASRISS